MQQPQPQPYAFAPPPQKKSNTVLIVLLIVGGVILLVVVLVGVLAVLGISGTRKYVTAAKTAEATNSIGAISRSATAAYEADMKLCPSASRPVPASISQVSGIKYMSSAGDWTVDSASNAGFACLKFEMTTPQYYQYDYHSTATSYTAEARGDLDADGKTSSFVVTGTISGGSILAGWPKQTDPEE